MPKSVFSLRSEQAIPENDTSRITGLAAWCCAICYAIGLGMVFFIAPGLNQGAEERLGFILQFGTIVQVWYFVIFVLFGISLTVFNLGMRRLLSPSPSIALKIAFIVSLIWSAYVFASGLISVFTIQFLFSIPIEEQRSLWFAIYEIQSGLGEGVEWVGGLWMTVLNYHLLKYQNEHRWLNRCGFSIGIVGLVTLIPGYAVAGAIFGVSQLIWFVVTGFTLIHKSQQFARG